MTGKGELEVASLKKYIQYCKAKCAPVLGEEPGDVLASSYVRIRNDVRQSRLEVSRRSAQRRTRRIERTATAHCPEQHAQGDADDKTVIPITVRPLEALVRLSESLAKMRSDSEVQPQDTEEALRLFRVSAVVPLLPRTAKAVDKESKETKVNSMLSSWLRNSQT